MWTLQWRLRACVLNSLIRTVTAIVFTVTDISLEHAFVVVALVEVVRTCNLTTIVLIAVIVAVLGAITTPSDRYTDSRRLALEVLLSIALIRCNRRTAQLIASIITVRYAVTLVRFFDALSKVGALELRRQARNWWTILFILLVEAVLQRITSQFFRGLY